MRRATLAVAAFCVGLSSGASAEPSGPLASRDELLRLAPITFHVPLQHDSVVGELGYLGFEGRGHNDWESNDSPGYKVSCAEAVEGGLRVFKHTVSRIGRGAKDGENNKAKVYLVWEGPLIDGRRTGILYVDTDFTVGLKSGPGAEGTVTIFNSQGKLGPVYLIPKGRWKFPVSVHLKRSFQNECEPHITP